MEYILHIGLMKTGTKSLQQALADNRETLRRHGVVYPSIGISGLGCVKHKEWVHFFRGDFGKLTRMPEQFVERLNAETAGADICVMSCEAFASLKPEAVASLLPRDRTRVVMYVREPVAYMASKYRHNVKIRRMSMSFREYARSRELRFLYHAERWAAVFGKENVLIRLSDQDGGQPDVVSDFAKLIGLELDDAFPRCEYEMNPGIAGNLLFVKRVLNCLITREEAYSPIRREIIDLQNLDSSFRGKMPVGQETVDLIARKSQEVLEGLESRFGVSVRLRKSPIEAPPCPDYDNLGSDFARILAAAREMNGKLAPLLERMAGMFAN